MKLKDITSGLLELFKSNHYHPLTIKFYQREWNKIEKFLVSNYQTQEFDIEKGLLYLEKQYGFITKHSEGTLSQQRIQLLRVVHMLEDYQLHRVLTKRYHASKNPIKLTQGMVEVYDCYTKYLEKQELSATTRESYGRIVEVFLDYLGQRQISIPGDLNLQCCHKYIRTLAGFSFKTIEQKICGIRHFLRFLNGTGRLEDDIAAKIVMPWAPKAPRVPSVWDPEDLKKLLKAVNREEPLGKRDYAMLLLACGLGLRSGDIKRLQFGHINWEKKQISFVQHKTNKPLTLPLPNCVGWALIDYIKHARPKFYETSRIFLKHFPPFGEFGDSNHLAGIVQKYMRKAGIYRRNKHSGFHSLRHSAASMLLEMGTPLPVITDILGHTDSDVTAVYLKSDLKKLRQCVLEPEDFS